MNVFNSQLWILRESLKILTRLPLCIRPLDTSINPSSLPHLRLWIFPSFFPIFPFFPRSDDSTWFFIVYQKKKRIRKGTRKMRRSIHAVEDKMIITTTIWWVHNWLNIKNCSEIFGSVARMLTVERRGGKERRLVVLGFQFKRKGREWEMRKKKSVHFLCASLQYFYVSSMAAKIDTQLCYQESNWIRRTCMPNFFIVI